MIKRKKYILITLVLFVLLFLTFEMKYYYYGSKTPLKKEVPKKNLYDRVLVIAPHPDDESLGAAGIIQNAIKNGGKVKVVVITNGDGFTRAVMKNYNISFPKPHDYIKMGYERQKETLNALSFLGVKKNDIIFLGYPDKGLSYLWGDYWNTPYKSFGPKVTHSPYDNSFDKNVEYEGKKVVKDLTKIINDYDPTLVVYPHPNEVHPDHWGTNSFTKYTLFTLKKNDIPQYLYIIHRSDWPLPFGKHTYLNLNPPPNLLNTGTNWHLYPLTNHQIDKKGTALLMYKTQVKVMKDFLSAFCRKTELFGDYKDGIIKNYTGGNLDNYKAIIDPFRDNLRDYENSAADITYVYAYTENNKLNIYIKCREKANSDYEYLFYGIFFKDNKEIGRIKARVISGKMKNMNFGYASIKNGIVHITIPFDKYKGFDYIYIAVDSLANKRLIDKSAWHMLKRAK
ncbi:PIG-L family deacetylase [Thermoanaerobacterium sp. RBIITD]|uniref:PIG-L deacetylase family protein n=1 Tax=Thermoanaerobacterium sp. RBIITD TaxID=1550240 RepID=UPI000BB9114C|nr:PIG-L family deacetylase [Thermoanaerobacterium sp. RBIITD]SNX52685.1 N-acetylglucosaminyl deacetylase, LmbE family [Thermoanaerobacterium sp. RBIITD]